MLIITPSLNFHGQCEEAINMYKKAFNAKIDCMLRYSDADARDWSRQLSPDEANYIYHAEIYIGNQRIMLSDILEFSLSKGTALFLTVTFETKEDVQKAYDILKENCEIIYPLHSTTYSSCIVVLVDKFGFRWGLMTEQTEK